MQQVFPFIFERTKMVNGGHMLAVYTKDNNCIIQQKDIRQSKYFQDGFTMFLWRFRCGAYVYYRKTIFVFILFGRRLPNSVSFLTQVIRGILFFQLTPTNWTVIE